MDLPVYQHLSVAAHIRPVQLRAGKDSGTDDRKDIAALSDPAYVPDVNNSAYIIFMLIAIVGYFTIPTVSTWVIQASGAGNYGKQVNSWSLKGGRAAAAVSGAAVGHVAGKLRGR